MSAANPVGVGQVDADGSGWVEVTRQDGGGDYLGADTLHLLFFELLIYRRVIFKPLGILANQFGAASSLQIFEVNQRLPAGLHAQGVTITFGETVNKINA